MTTNDPELPQAVSQMALYHFRSTNADRTTRGHRIIQGSTTLEYRWGFAPSSQPTNPEYLVTVQLQHWDAIAPETYTITLVNQTYELREIKLIPVTIVWSNWIVVLGSFG